MIWVNVIPVYHKFLANCYKEWARIPHLVISKQDVLKIKNQHRIVVTVSFYAANKLQFLLNDAMQYLFTPSQCASNINTLPNLNPFFKSHLFEEVSKQPISTERRLRTYFLDVVNVSVAGKSFNDPKWTISYSILSWNSIACLEISTRLQIALYFLNWYVFSQKSNGSPFFYNHLDRLDVMADRLCARL